MADLNCYTTTFNCGRSLVDTEFFAANFFNGLKTNVPPDLVVLCLEEIAPIGYSFLGGSFLTPYFNRLTTAIHLAAVKRFERGNEYVRVLVRNVGMTAIMVFARASVEERIRGIETAGVGVGVWEMGNKGAVGARLALQSDGAVDETVPLTFIAAHLAPMEEAWQRRNEDWKNICKGLVFGKDQLGSKAGGRDRGEAETEPLLAAAQSAEDNDKSTESSIFSPVSHVFFAGDLNYRTSDTPPDLDDPTSFPQPLDSAADIRYYGHFLEKDQLNRERKQGNTLHHLSEATIEFPPTYKYSSTAQHQASRASYNGEITEDQSWLWAQHRFPSWCDRILYLETAPPTVHEYTALPVQPTSDHRPVALSFSIPLKALPQAAQAIKAPFPVRQDWREARVAARRYEIIVGFAAYLTLTWEGEALLAGSLIGIIGGYLALRALLAA